MIREFVGRDGRPWKVWQVTPTVDAATAREHLPGDLRAGWLCFDGGPQGKRRFAPVPPAWESRTDAELAVLCHCAVAARSRSEAPQVADA